MEYRIGLRPSRLSLRQAEEAQGLLPQLKFNLIPIQTRGDRDKHTSLFNVEGSDFFTREIEEALLNRSIDAAVHSAKDVEETMPAGLVIAAITASISPYECLVCRKQQKLSGLPAGARIGTSSAKRKEALNHFRPDLAVADIRGSIEERLAQLDNNKYDAVIMAHAALIRLGYEERISEIISPEIIPPHPLQGSLAIQVRAGDTGLIRLFSAIDTRKEALPDEDKS